jgi:hypothetical protein
VKSVLLWLYIAAYAAVAVVSWLDDEGPPETPAEFAFDVVLAVLLFVGMILYARRVQQPLLIRAWKFVAPAILIAQIVQLVLAWPELSAPDPEMDLSATAQKVIVAAVLFAVALFLAPAHIVNFRFARSRPLDPAREAAV